MRASVPDPREVTLSQHFKAQWHRRGEELLHWIAREKISIGNKRIAVFDNTVVDEQLLQALILLKQKGIVTEFSCAGVSLLDEVEDHSLYAYITLIGNENSHAFIQAAM
ncbi:hypothetical protein [Paenibacillus pectinilyticus]|uniref:hypothetical protein n=1 Tax=Paenibacillus pectinilyticus TaxID=512399 RepID=UPI001FCA1BE7|nr:hypothetical protein [Paenibacillus pectinilyticus]